MIDDRFRGIVITISVLAAIGGLIFGVVPGSDIPILLILWTVGIVLIVSRIDRFSLSEHWFRLVLVSLFVYVILSAGIATVQTLTLPLFFVVNPILDGIATYRILRATAKLFTRRDVEETTSTGFTVFWSMAKDVIHLIAEFFGLGD